ncbi:MAG: cytidylate kinase-like family protein [Clostridiales bacterium]|nr:cytidylate kinase-like family protein [Clostridiales bacterium]
MMNEEANKIKELAECIYDLDAEVYSQLGSSIGRVYTRDREHCVNEIERLLVTRSESKVIRSELALISNMARTIPDKQERKLVMTEYNRIIQAVSDLPDSFSSGDVINLEQARLNRFHLRNRFSDDDHMIICISWAYGSGGADIGFRLADRLKINFYDKEILEAVLKRLDAQKDLELIQASAKANPNDTARSHPEVLNLSEALRTDMPVTLRQRMREFSRYHGLPKQDAIFFNQSDLLCEMAKQEDFVIMGRCAKTVMTNNRIPHISIFISAPMEQRVRRIMEINSRLSVRQAQRMIRKADEEHRRYINFYTGGEWGHANNYDLCINSASYGIEGTVDFILGMIGDWKKKKQR